MTRGSLADTESAREVAKLQRQPTRVMFAQGFKFGVRRARRSHRFRARVGPIISSVWHLMAEAV